VWLGLGLGSLGMVFVQFLTGGNWGLATRRIFEAAAGTIPVMVVLFVPLFFGLSRLYVWTQPQVVAADAVLQHKAIYLNQPFFLVRTVVYLTTWVVLSVMLRRRSIMQDRTNDRFTALRRLQRFSIVAIPALGVTVSFAAIDWLMSLEADWYSTMYPPLVAMSFMLASLAFGIVVTVFLVSRTPLGEMATPQLFNDLGSLLLAFLMLWAYMEYFQYLLIWAGNLTDEIPWYIRRVEGGWLPVAVSLGAVGFLVPFWLLLFRPLKRNRRTLAWIAAWILVIHLVDVYWMIEPAFAREGPAISVFDLLALLGLGGIWLATFSWQLSARPLLAPNDPRLPVALEAAREPA